LDLREQAEDRVIRKPKQRQREGWARSEVRDKRGSESRERRQISDSRFALAFAHTTTPYILLLLASLNPYCS
jgi:hypothetical protein